MRIFILMMTLHLSTGARPDARDIPAADIAAGKTYFAPLSGTGMFRETMQ